jgi:hypothetical protein
MNFHLSFITLLLVQNVVFSQTIKSSFEFYDTTANVKVGEIGWSGAPGKTSFFVESDGKKKISINSDTTNFTGFLKADGIIGDGSKLTNITADSIMWSTIKGIPAGFADGVDNTGGSTGDSARAAAVADSTKKIPDGSVTTEKLNALLKVKDDNIDSVSWSKIKGIPAGFADGIDNTAGSLGDSVRAASIADYSKNIADGSITNAKLATSLKVKDENIDSVSWSKIKGRPTKVDSAKVANKADSLGNQPSANYALKSFIKSNYDSTAINAKADTNYVKNKLTTKADVFPTGAVGAVWKVQANGTPAWGTDIDTDISGGDSSFSMRTLSNAVARISSDVATSFKSITVSAPSSGYVLVWATATLSPFGSGPYCALYGAIANTSGQTSFDFHHTIHWNANTPIPNVFSINQMFPVSAGDNTFYLKFWKASPSSSYQDGQIDAISLTALFVKNRL